MVTKNKYNVRGLLIPIENNFSRETETKEINLTNLSEFEFKDILKTCNTLSGFLTYKGAVLTVDVFSQTEDEINHEKSYIQHFGDLTEDEIHDVQGEILKMKWNTSL